MTNINTYDEYGVPGSGNAGRFSYTGQMHLPEIGLYHYRARMYNPFTGRFLQTDPVGYADQMNLYAYVHNDPMNASDPSGESTVYGGTSAPTMRAIQDACGGANNACVRGVAGSSLRVGATAFGAAGMAGLSTSTLGIFAASQSLINGGAQVSLWATVAGVIFGAAADLSESSFVNEGTLSDAGPTALGFATESALRAGRVPSSIARILGENVEAASKTLGTISTAAGTGVETVSTMSVIAGKAASNSENGMNAGKVRICNGMGAEKGGCQN